MYIFAKVGVFSYLCFLIKKINKMMTNDLDDIKKASEILKKENENPYIAMISRKYNNGEDVLNDFNVNYIIENNGKKSKPINKTILISDWLGNSLKDRWNLEFSPKKLFVTYMIGETDATYNLYVYYRKSQEHAKMCFLPKSGIFTDMECEDYKSLHIDFSKYNKKSGRTLKPHQEKAVKFLICNKKCILDLEMGLGKTTSSIVASIEGGFSKILVICPASLKTNWKEEISIYADEKDIAIVNGQTWEDKKYTIINYDIVDNFYNIPTQMVERKEKYVGEDGVSRWRKVMKEVMSKDKKYITEKLKDSQLYQSKFDLIIIDEMHKLSNSKSIRYKVITDLIKRSNPSAIYGLTGTMITNNPMNLYNVLKIIGAGITKNWTEYVKRYCDGKEMFVKSDRDKVTNAFLKRNGKTSWGQLTYSQKDELKSLVDKNCRKIWATNGASNLEELSERIKHLYLREINSNVNSSITKDTEVMEYELNKNEREKYDLAWNEYVRKRKENGNDTVIDNKQLVEGSVLRQCCADLMISRTIDLAKKKIKEGSKVIIACCFDKEVESFSKEFGKKCVTFNGKMTLKQKDEARKNFCEKDEIKVFVGNITASCVGLNLIESNVIIFNSVSWMQVENEQMEFRILRIGQQKDCHIIYQKFVNTYMDRIFDILDVKKSIAGSVVLTENEK